MLYQGFKSEQDPNGTAYFYHHDGEGNVIATTKHSGQSDHSYRFDDYGGILPDNGSTASNRNEGSNGWIAPHNSYTLSQKQYDGHTNLYYFGSRHYDPEVGVWLTQDSYRGELPNPQSLHRYMYNYDSPVNYVDWYGFKGEQYPQSSQPLLYTPINQNMSSVRGNSKDESVSEVNQVSCELPAIPLFAGTIIGPYSQITGLYKGTGLEAHHLIEQRFARTLGLQPRSMGSTPLSPSAHQPITNAWRNAIGYQNSGSPINTQTATPDDILKASREIYRNDPALRKAAEAEIMGSPAYTITSPTLLQILMRSPILFLIVPTEVLEGPYFYPNRNQIQT